MATTLPATLTGLLSNLTEIFRLRDDGAIFYVSHSGGKDSQAMFLLVQAIIPADQLVVIYADLGRVVWDTMPHIEATTGRRAIRSTPVGRGKVQYTDYHTGATVPCPRPQDALLVCKCETRDFLSLWDAKGRAPSPANPQCTSDLKRGPIERTVRNFIKDAGVSKLAVSCIGIRKAESSRRDKNVTAKGTLVKNKSQSVAGRTWYNWLAIANLKCSLDNSFDAATQADHVMQAVTLSGQELHPVYAKGMRRLSCCFCIMASPQDHAIAASLRPELLAEYAAMEQKTGFTLFNGQSITERVAEGNRRLNTTVGHPALQLAA